MEEKLTQLKELLGEVDDLNKAATVLDWDQQTYMPPGGVEGRAMQMATLQKLAHAKFISDDMRMLMETLRPLADELDADSNDACLIRVAAREYNKAVKVPSELVAELAQKTALAHNIWVQARQEKNFAAFQPALEELVTLIRRQAECLGYTDHIYDPLLDIYEPGMKTAEVTAVFDQLKPALIPLVKAVAEQQDAVRDTVFQQKFDVDAQWQFTLDVLQEIGYDFNRGRQDKTPHPFTTTFSPGDVRVTTRVSPDTFGEALSSSIHEGGHALYEQGISPALGRTLLYDGTSMAVHESQSRMWENVIGKSRAFWTYFLPKLHAGFPQQTQGVDVDLIYQSLNVVKPDFIRVEADELTYNFHIFLRFELETALMAGDIQVKDLPEAWNAKMQEYLGITPPDAALGVLQDVHWSAALFGYFPTYALGNVLSLQFYQCILRDIPDLSDQISQGEFGPLLNWLREHIHRHGSKFPPKELIQRVTGEGMNPQPFVDYVKAKYGELYGISE